MGTFLCEGMTLFSEEECNFTFWRVETGYLMEMKLFVSLYFTAIPSCVMAKCCHHSTWYG